jgi:hypothetical protein
MAEDKNFTVEELHKLVGVDRKGEVEAFLESVKSSGNPLAGLKPESFGSLLKAQPDFSKIFDSEVSRRVENGVKTWQEKNLDKIYQERYSKEHPAETDEQKRIRALEVAKDESDKRAVKAELKNQAIGLFTAANVGQPAELADLLFDGETKEPADRVKFLSTYINELVGKVEKATTEKLLKNNGRTIGGGEGDNGKYYTRDQIDNMSQSEFNQNYTKVMDSLRFLQTR